MKSRAGKYTRALIWHGRGKCSNVSHQVSCRKRAMFGVLCCFDAFWGYLFSFFQINQNNTCRFYSVFTRLKWIINLPSFWFWQILPVFPFNHIFIPLIKTKIIPKNNKFACIKRDKQRVAWSPNIVNKNVLLHHISLDSDNI